MVQHYVEFFYTDKFPVGPEAEPIAERDDELVQLPAGAKGYRFFDREENIVEGELKKGEPYNYSGYTYYGREFSLREIRKALDRNSRFVKMMKKLGYKRAIVIDQKHLFCIEEEDKVVDVL